MIELWQLPLLFATGLVAGFVDSIAGGGGLIALPVLLSCGLDPRHALGTSKLQSTFGSGSAAWHYAQAGTVDLKDCTRGFVLSIVGAALGALAVQRLDPSFLRRTIPILLIAVALYVLASPRILIPILELYQNADGSIAIPEALRPYTPGSARIG